MSLHVRCSLGRAAAGLLFVLVQTAGWAAEKPRTEADLLAAAAAALRGEDPAALRALAANAVGSTSFGWARRAVSLVGGYEPWQAGILDAPGAPARYLAVSRYQVCESASDHLFPIVYSPNGPRIGDEVPETETGGFRIREHRLGVRFDPAARTATIRDHFRVERTSDSKTLVVRLNAPYAIDGVSQAGRPSAYRRSGGFLAIAWPGGRTAAFDLSYHARLTTSNEDFVRADHAALTSYWYPHIARLPAAHSVTITVPRGWSAIGQGAPTGRKSGKADETWSWSSALPVSYFTVVAGKFHVTTGRVGDTLVSAWLLKADRDRAARAIQTAGKALQWFGKAFSAYPFKQYAVVESSVYPAALEGYSFALCGRSVIPLAIVHEVAHTWWGGMVPNTYTRSLWNESFAEYSDGLYGRIAGGEGIREFSTRMAGMLGPLFSRASLLQAHDAMEPAESAVGYGKGSLVLENLEQMVGQDKMLAALKRFVAKRTPGEPAEWADFIRALADVAGAEWRGYFDSWLSRTDLPDFRLEDVKRESAATGWVVSGRITQKGAGYWARIPLVISTDSGRMEHPVVVRGDEPRFRIEAASKPVKLALDPDRVVLRAVVPLAAGMPDPAVTEFP